MTHTLLDSRHTASRARRATWAIYALIRPRFLCCDFAGFIRLPIASSRPSIRANSRLLPFLREWRWKNWGKPLASRADQSKHADQPLRLKEIYREWNTRNRRTEAGMNYRSDILHLRPGRKLSGKRLSPHGRSGRRRAASRNQGNWVAAIAGAMTWLRVSSSGGIGDAASVSVNAMGRRPGGGGRRSRNSSNTTSDEWPGSKGSAPFVYGLV